jgi:hypothetical protein
MKKLLAMTTISASLFGCSTCPTGTDHVPHLSGAQAVDIANSAAKSAGYRVEDYALPDAHFEYTKRACTWSIFYYRSDDAMPGHFQVIVNDRTKGAEIFGGS